MCAVHIVVAIGFRVHIFQSISTIREARLGEFFLRRDATNSNASANNTPRPLPLHSPSRTLAPGVVVLWFADTQ
jgi:hypothetical protein